MAAPAGPLLEQLRRDAAATAAAQVEAARSEAARIRAAAADGAAVRHAEAIAARESDAAAELELARASAAQRVRLDTLTARAEALDRVFAAAELQLPALAAHPGLGAVVARAIVEGIGCVPEDGVTVRCARAVADAVRQPLAAMGMRADIVTVDESVPVGALVASADGGIVVNATFARRLLRDRQALSIPVARRLAEGAA